MIQENELKSLEKHLEDLRPEIKDLVIAEVERLEAIQSQNAVIQSTSDDNEKDDKDIN